MWPWPKCTPAHRAVVVGDVVGLAIGYDASCLS
jgi:hypothetical protein